MLSYWRCWSAYCSAGGTGQSHPQMVIVVVSGFDDLVLRQEAALVGATYLLKPQELPILRAYLPPPTGS